MTPQSASPAPLHSRIALRLNLSARTSRPVDQGIGTSGTLETGGLTTGTLGPDGSATDTSPTRHPIGGDRSTNLSITPLFKPAFLRRTTPTPILDEVPKQAGLRCPNFSHRQHLGGSLHSHAWWPKHRHLKQRTSLRRNEGLSETPIGLRLFRLTIVHPLSAPPTIFFTQTDLLVK
ncbi:hypothetical protein QJS04_geneDACA017686 [Acorus gramineus]|uniref:Uncharacterized protein n=1 Tax=Acorus gramineus TaxID=55184 RepID=A0AAV9BTL3_ACOGR|nr:hypothetical protein QJS04_geneDACA017686 [Acorus gramineus]